MLKHEILKRMAEIKRMLESGEDINLEEIEIELRDLEQRLTEIENREKIAREINLGEREERKLEKPESREKETRIPTKDTEEYRSGFLKNLLGRNLTEAEKRSIAADDVAGVVPTQTSEKIMNKVRDMVPLLNEVTLLRVAGNVTYAVEGTNNDASLHTENAELTAQSDTLTNVSLTGYEIAKLVRISKTVQTMSINAFEGWLADLLAENIATKIEYYLINGTGSSQPEGVDYANTWVDGTNAVDFASANPTIDELDELVGYLKGGYFRKAKWLMNHKTFWKQVQTQRDDSTHQIIYREGDKYYLLGKEVLYSDYVNDGDMFLGDYSKIVANLAQDVEVSSSAHSGFIYNSIDFRGAAIFDSKVAIGEAFVKGAATL